MGCGLEDLDGIVYIVGFGLVGVFFVGIFIGCFLVYGWNILVVVVYYMEGYFFVLMFEEDKFEFLFIVLLVFGGYIMMVKVFGIGEYEVLGELVDDVVGEVFDKMVKLFGFDYLGGLCLVKFVE